ncbi:phosphate ABC transporter substrate-binding/OmpA family protein [uncultured Roseobacter sp.]|uniref:phosphate ABC transporter substrate-binding/OmpA family protein n=1 Tax=uncultured Roseobacter sp. TaxID=114847 RepID=UPI0026059336|nr:phosphate ABC transporter substrate-binding/OmpA family protein [uncultured Roseobacter sp.]
MTLLRAAFCAALFLFALCRPLGAEDVTLTSRDGEVELSGTLLGFDGELYRIDTIYGELTVDGSGVTCDGPACPSLEDYVAEIRISGAASMGTVMVPALIETFAQRNGYNVTRETQDASHRSYSLTDPDSDRVIARFFFRLTNTDEGFADLLANEADIVMALREIRAGERDRALEAGMGDVADARRARVLALDAVVPVVAPDNPVRSVSLTELARIYAGEIRNWSALGGPDSPITLYAPDAETGLAQAFERQVMARSSLEQTGDIRRFALGEDLARAVVADPFGLGITSYAETGRAQVLSLRGGCGRNLVAGRQTIKTEDYPLTAPMFLYRPARRLPRTGREFLAFATSSAAQLVIRRSGFVDQAPELVSLELQGNRLANAIDAAGPEITLEVLKRMISVLSPRKRLTTSFRFETGSARLDAQSRSNVVRLAEALERGRYDSRELLFVGFSDGDGSALANQSIALRRAETVRRAVLDAAETFDSARAELRVDAFGEAMPVACDTSEWGRLTNRRVEVWLR